METEIREAYFTWGQQNCWEIEENLQDSMVWRKERRSWQHIWATLNLNTKKKEMQNIVQLQVSFTGDTKAYKYIPVVTVVRLKYGKPFHNSHLGEGGKWLL